jgi:hypothetical protein
MALARFFQKAALSAGQAVRTLGQEALATRLRGAMPAVVFDGATAGRQEGRVALELTVNLLARLYPQIALASLDSGADALRDELTALARAINPEIEVRFDSGDAHITVAAVSCPLAASSPVVYLGSDGWTAWVGSAEPLPVGDSFIPFGGAAAACLAVANVFRHFFQSELGGGRLDRSASLSLASMNTGAGSGPSSCDVDLGEWHLVGAGAVGSAALWALNRASGLRGVLHVVDHEDVDVSNLQRYVLFGDQDVSASKALAAESMFKDGSLSVRGYRKRWGEYLAERGQWNLDRVAVAVDSGPARVAVQASLPRRILNAWTQNGDLGVSRHRFMGEGGCLACMYLPLEKRRNEDELIAEALGVPEAVRDVRELLHRATGVPRQFLERVALARQVPLDALLRFEGRPLRVFHSEGVCGGLLLALGASDATAATREAETPLAFQSALAGILLAAEMVLHGTGARPDTFPEVTSINLLKRFPDEVTFRRLKTPGGRCLCQDPDYIARYRRKYEAAS